jgi:hypothetical protein
MTTDLLTNIGEEYMVDESPDSNSHDVGLYLDTTDGLSDTSTLSAITTEPTNTNYSRQTSTVTTAQLSGDYGWDNDSQLSFDFSDQSSSQNVDAAFEVVNFASSVAVPPSPATDHLIDNPALSQTRDIGSIDTLDIAAGDLEVTVN